MSSALVATYPDILTDPRMVKLLNPWQYSALQNQFNSEPTAAEQASARRFTENHVKILRAGGIVIGGTDEPLGLNDWGLQPTIAGFVEYGFTPYEALRTVTALPAMVMGLDAHLGTVKRGRLADLAFVRGNPLRDIHAAADVQMVMKNGRLFTVDELIGPYADADLNGAAAQAPPPSRATVASLCILPEAGGQSTGAGDPVKQNARINDGLDVTKVVGPDEGRISPPIVDHTGGGCCC